MSVMHAVEFTILKTKTTSFESYYKPIGYLVPYSDSGDAQFNEEDISFIKDSKYFDYEDKRRLCSGVIDGINNTDFEGVIFVAPLYSDYPNLGVHNTDMYIYGTLVECTFDEEDGCGKITIIVEDIEEGYSPYVVVGEKLNIMLRSEYLYDIEDALDEMKIGSRYFLRCYKDNSSDIKTRKQFFLGWLLMKPLDTENSILFIEVMPKERIDLSSSLYTNILNDIEILRENMNTMMFESTKDMKSITDFHDSARMYRLLTGRLLTMDDYINKNPVCVIPDELGNYRNLTIGDKITVNMRNIYDSSVDILPYITDEQVKK